MPWLEPYRERRIIQLDMCFQKCHRIIAENMMMRARFVMTRREEMEGEETVWDH